MRRLALPLALALLLAPATAGARGALALRYAPVTLPGAPAALVTADLDGDGVRDLAVVVAYTRWDQMEIEESVRMDDVEGLAEMLTVVPALLDHRELRVFRGRPAGGFEPSGPAMALDTSVLSLEAGLPGAPVVALTDQGLSALRLRSSPAGPRLALEPLIRERPALAGTGTFLPNLGLVQDLDGDGRADVLLPTEQGATVYLSGPDGLRGEPASRLRFPLAELQRPGAGPLSRYHPIPEVRDVDGDHLPDLLLRHETGGWDGFRVMRNRGNGRFAEAVAPLGPFDARRMRWQRQGESVSFFGDLDGDGRAEYVTEEQQGPGEDASFRKEMEQAKRPRFLYRIYRSRPDLAPEPAPFQQFQGLGYAFGEGGDDEGNGGGDHSVSVDIRLPGGFQDLDGDGRLDLVAMTLDFSLFQAVRIVALKRISLGVDFQVQCQGASGGFAPVRGLDLSGKLQIDLNNLQLGHLSQFAGDFDGDGRADFVQMGRGRTVTIHRGGPGCAYPARPDLSLQLRDAPRDLALVQVRDLDGDGLADLVLIQPQTTKEAGVTPPVRLDLYLSRGAV
jgi:hypothetical protein